MTQDRAYVRYLSNVSIALIGLSVVLILISRLLSIFSHSSSQKLSPNTLTSPSGDVNLVELEAVTILSALAANVLPAPKDGETEVKLGGKEAGEVVEDFGKNEDGKVRRWRNAKWSLGVGGAMLWTGVTVLACMKHGDWKTVAFPVSHH